MKNPSMEQTIFDAVLTRAFADAVAEELAEIERDCPAVDAVDYPEKYRKIERKAYRKRWGGGFRMSRTMQRAAAWILAIGLAGGALVMAVPEVRAGFRNLVATSFEKYITFESATTSATHSDKKREYCFEYMPENYEETEYSNKLGVKYKFESIIDDTYFKISYYPCNSISFRYDNEHSTVTEYEINGNNAYLIYFELDEDYTLTWNDGVNIFRIDGNISADEILKIARNIFRIE